MSLDIRLIAEDGEIVFSENITHNLNTMADKADIYEAVWRPEELGKEKAGEIFLTIAKGLKILKEKPDYFKQFDASNGWGTYDDFVPWVEKYLEACELYPDAMIEVSR